MYLYTLSVSLFADLPFAALFIHVVEVDFCPIKKPQSQWHNRKEAMQLVVQKRLGIQASETRFGKGFHQFLLGVRRKKIAGFIGKKVKVINRFVENLPWSYHGTSKFTSLKR